MRYFEHETESALYEAANRALNTIAEAGSNYDEAFAAMASLRPEVNDFFESVMVMVDDEAVRNNRLSLLRKIANGFRQLADLRQLSSDTV
jgi:glycyl-tRNA synthetase beta chain